MPEKDNNGLAIKKIYTKCLSGKHEKIAGSRNLESFITGKMEKFSGYAAAYMDNVVRIGKFDDGGGFRFYDMRTKHIVSSLNPANIKKLRIFDDDRELMLWRVSSHENNPQSETAVFNWRLRIDSDNRFPGCEPEPVDVIEANQALFGTDAVVAVGAEDEFSILTEQRVADIPVPIPGITMDSCPLWLQTRNYIKYFDNIAGYNDSRFTGFKQNINCKDSMRG